MTAIMDRQGRGLELTAYGAEGKAVKLKPAELEAALRLKRALPGKPELYARAIGKILGLVPARLGIRLWNEKEILLNAPYDLGNFLWEIDGIILCDQYNAGDLAGKTVVDAGANIGIFSLYALALGAKKVYAFEAVAETYEILKSNLALNGAQSGVKAVNIALGAEKGQACLKFNIRGEGSSMIDSGEAGVNRGILYKGRRTVAVAPLDALLKGRVDFIKMDVEGYEMRVLQGAARLIKKYKPVLSLAAYHKPADKKELPKAVLALRDDYQITLNTFAEHDLYCQ